MHAGRLLAVMIIYNRLLSLGVQVNMCGVSFAMDASGVHTVSRLFPGYDSLARATRSPFDFS